MEKLLKTLLFAGYDVLIWILSILLLLLCSTGYIFIKFLGLTVIRLK